MIDELKQMAKRLNEMKNESLNIIFKNIHELPEERKKLIQDLLTARIEGNHEEVKRLEKILKDGE